MHRFRHTPGIRWLLPLLLLVVVCSQTLGLQHLSEHALEAEHVASCSLDAPLDHQTALIADAAIVEQSAAPFYQAQSFQNAFHSRAEGLAQARAPPVTLC